MKEHEISRKDASAKALKLLSAAKTVFLATNGGHGHPNLRAMAPITFDGVQTIWFSTSSQSSKIIELAKDDKAVVYGYSPRSMSEFRLWGSVEILDDQESREHIWRDFLRDHFPDGAGDPNLRVLRFSAISGMYTAKDGSGGVFDAKESE
ncbi:MAG: pyridoxamine 5'-phosphate oxidase family protein [Synergistaceae bacterium]|jgi:general stress protein 26|nr:pyridoxamine 5'-phosphate oxidase family protein [Synergistaceae bacterium]